MDLSVEKPLSGQTALVTGSARRLGMTISKKLAQMGCNLILHYNYSQKEVQELSKVIQSYGVESWTLQVELTNSDDIHSFVNKAFSLSPVNILVNNASIFSDAAFSYTSLGTWNEHINVNLTAPFLLSKAFAKYFIPGKVGRIINLVDWRALRPGKDHFSYTISKSALAAFTSSLALELAPEITVNAIALGAILPPENEPPDPALLNKIPLKRWANLIELENLIEYLVTISPALTGQIIHLDGGRHLIYK